MSAFLWSLLFSSIYMTALVESSSGGGKGGITVDLFHRDSLQLPSNTRFQRLRSALARAMSRKSSLMASSSTSTGPVTAPISPAGGEYLMKFKIGTPPVEQLGIADTGSDLTWTQCKPCTQCYKQTLPLFDPSQISSYRPVSCESDQCTCQYDALYGDLSYSSGELATETLTLDGGVSFPKLAFGCGHENGCSFSETESGIVGLGGGSISIVNQLQSSIGGKFSYCLTLLDSNATSKISFGSSAVIAGPKVVSTPLVRKSPATFYYLTLEGISVGTERLDYTAGTKAADEGNIIIDSGTTLSFVPSEFYYGVESALEVAITATRVADPQRILNMCYETGGDGGFSSPPITAHFKNADVVLPQEGIFVEVAPGIVCLTLVPFAIFGNLHQMNYHIGYDLVKKEVSFLPTDCSKPQ